jgi:hypothetical protein
MIRIFCMNNIYKEIVIAFILRRSSRALARAAEACARRALARPQGIGVFELSFSLIDR